jgi:hypothetical protein
MPDAGMHHAKSTVRSAWINGEGVLSATGLASMNAPENLGRYTKGCIKGRKTSDVGSRRAPLMDPGSAQHARHYEERGLAPKAGVQPRRTGTRELKEQDPS